MAELLRFETEVELFKTELLCRHREAEENRLRENQAAIQIQSWFRSCKVRAYLSHLHKKAIIIQKIWRGFTARAHFRQMVKEAYFIMKMNFYEEMAVRIQRTWRGYFSRKFIHNFYARKRYLEGVVANNELVRRQLDELEQLQKKERDCVQKVRQQTEKIYETYRSHHLLGTKQRPGVLNPSFRSAPQEREQLLRQVKYQVPTRLAPRRNTCVLSMPDPTAPSFPESLKPPWITANSCCHSSSSILPPIGSKKQQVSQPVCHRRRDEEDWPLVLAGPLREPGEVWEQCVKCPELTLGLQSSYMQLEAAKNQLQQYESIKLPRTIRRASVPCHQDLGSSFYAQPAYAKKFSL